MESGNVDSKYQKLATEYSKIRAQASVLKRAVLDEQNKNSNLRETLRLKESTLRRTEQELDSLTFRNKQLEHRVSNLQEDLNGDMKKFKNNKSNIKNRNNNEISDPIVTEELQKKIYENAQMASMISDKDSELVLFKNRVLDLEQQISTKVSESSEIERKLRKENEILGTKNAELETKVAEAASILGSEDGLSVAGSDHTPIHINSTTSEERITFLEKELQYWRTQYEIVKINEAFLLNKNDEKLLTNGPFNLDDKSLESKNIADANLMSDENTKEQLLFNHFSKKIEELFRERMLAESKVLSYIAECDSFQNNIELITNELKEMKIKYNQSQRYLQISEEDLTTTRINYEEQISLLTEQVISLSEQLADLK